MTTSRISGLAIALLAAVALSGCGEKSAEANAEPEHAEVQHSSAGLPSGNVTAGEKQAGSKNASTGQACVDCHGAEGNAPIDPSYPKLAGQYHDYIAHSLEAYRSGDREHALMSSQAKDLTDQQIADLAAYFGSRESSLHDLHGLK